jgi:hypothetical protein
MEWTMSASVYVRIAERYGVPTSDEAIEHFLLDVAPTLPREEREAILAELLADDAAEALTSATIEVPLEVPTFTIDDAPPAASLPLPKVSAADTRLRWFESALVYADVQETVREVVRRMADSNTAIVGIRDQEQLVGLLSEHDVIRRVVAEGLNPDDTSVADVMTRVN